MDRLFTTFRAVLHVPPVPLLLGLLVGSYLNVVALRWGTGSATRGRSRCPHCQRTLRWWELVPLISFALARGRCVRCGKRIGFRYPVVELLTGVAFVLLAGVGDGLVQTTALWLLASLLITLALIDLDQGLLPDQLTLGGTVAGLAYLLISGNSNVVGYHVSATGYDHWLVGILVGVGMLGGLVLSTRGKGMGLGDVKLGALIGMSLGGTLTLLALWAAFLVGALVGIGLVLMRRAQWRGTELPFGPFLALGWLVAVLWGPDIVAWYTGF